MTLRGLRLAATAALLLLPALATAETPLDKVKPAEIRARLKAAFDDKVSKEKIEKELAKAGVSFTVAPEGIDYSYAGGKPKLVWRYMSAAKLSSDDEKKVKTALQAVLSDVLSQARGGAGPLLSTADSNVFLAALEVRWDEPNTKPTITAVGAATAEIGKATTVMFTVADLETPAGELKVIATSTDPATLPADRLVVSGTGGDRALSLSPAAKATGPVTVTIKVTDAGGLTAETSFAVTVTAKPGDGGSGGTGNVSTAGAYAVVVYVWLPVARQPLFVPCGCRLFSRGCWGLPRGGAWTAVPAVVYWVAAPPAAPETRTPFTPPIPLTFAKSPDTYRPFAVPTVAAAPVPVERVVPRAELVKGKSEEDWVALYDAGYRQYWAGKYAQAVESCAAAAALKDDARAWYYLAFALRATGDTAGAQDAARYAAALEFTNPTQRHLVTDALRNVQGPARDELAQLRVGVGSERVARDLLATRPNTLPVTPTTTVATKQNP